MLIGFSVSVTSDKEIRIFGAYHDKLVLYNSNMVLNGCMYCGMDIHMKLLFDIQ